MKKLALISALFISVSSSAAFAVESYDFDPSHTSVTWHANHFGFSNPSGKFTDVSGSVVLDEAKPENSKVAVKIVLDSLETGNEKFNTHLKSPDFFDVAKYPAATFTSSKVEIVSKENAKVTGTLNLHGVEKPVTLDITLNKLGEQPMTKKKAAGFTASTTIKRSEFGINYGIPGVSDEVKIDIEAEAQVADAGAKTETKAEPAKAESGSKE